MADYQPLPDDDEAPAALTAAVDDYLRAEIPGWAPSDASPEVALRAAFGEEGSTLYALLRQQETDRFRDFFTNVYGVPAGAPTPATATTTWTARSAGPHTLEAGTTLVIDAANGPQAFEVLTEQTVADAETTITGVVVQAITAGSAATGATGDVLLDEPPAWVLSVTVDEPATGGTDGQTDEEHLETSKSYARLLHVAAVVDDDYEMVAQLVPTVARCLVLDRYNADTATEDVDGAVTLVPIDINGAGGSSATRTLVKTLVDERSVVNGLTYVVAPDLIDIAVAVTVAAEPGVDHDVIAELVEAAVRDIALNPALHGQPLLGERRTWKQRKTIRLYKVSDIVDDVDGVDYVDELTLSWVRPVTAVAVTDVITSTAHGFADADPIKFTGLAGGAPLADDTTYYVRDATADTFKVAVTAGGTAIDVTADITAGSAYRLEPLNLTMTGVAPLPNVTSVTVTVVDPS